MVNDIIKLDVHRDNGYQSIKAKQYDKNSRTITIKLFDNDVPRNIESNEKVRMRFTKSDGEWGIFDSDSKESNTAIFTIIPEMINVAGEVRVDVGIYKELNTGNPDDDELISSYLFYVNVEKSAYNEDSVMTSSETQTLLKLIAENRILKAELELKIARSQELITQMEQLIGM